MHFEGESAQVVRGRLKRVSTLSKLDFNLTLPLQPIDDIFVAEFRIDCEYPCVVKCASSDSLLRIGMFATGETLS
jgi:hypothetical protein